MVSTEFLGEALDSAPDAIVITDASGRILFANSRVSTLLGYDPSELVGESIEKLLPERFRRRHVSYRGRYTEQPSVRPMGTGLDLYALRKDATEVPVEISLSPIGVGGQRGLTAAAIRDATERRRTRLELVAAREVADLANQAKSRFLATASHDLRQSLQTLALLNGALRRMVEDPHAAEALGHQEQAISAMSRLLNALLDISKLESGAIRPDPTDFAIATLFEELRRDFSGLATNKGLELRVMASGDYAHSDRALVGQILRNLLANAIKYTTRGSVELRCTGGGPQAVHVAIQDTGIGIPADQIAHIYEEFYQVGVTTNRTREGYGLGLSIVRRLVALLELKIAVDSRPGQGTTFTLELPRGTAVSDVRSTPTPAGAQRTPAVAPLVLLVDDDAGVRGATAMLLRVEGFRVLPAASLTEAIAHARVHTDLTLLVTDYHLQDGETGTQVIEAVRELRGHELQAVLITGDTSSTVRELHADSRVHLVNKPVNSEQLLDLLRALTPP
jgi:PAS domain S-box-containing protein